MFNSLNFKRYGSSSVHHFNHCFVCSAAMVLASLFVHPNTNIVAIALLSLIFLGCIHLVKISYKELKSE